MARVIFYTGKGGVGKSVVSCMTAILAAEHGYKTLLISSDPAHTLRDALGVRVGSEPTQITENLWAVNVDPIREAAENYGVIIEYIASLLRAR
jgi:arsenite-transporting ATPase